MLKWRAVPDMNIPTDSTAPVEPTDVDYVPHLYQDIDDAAESKKDVATEDLQTDSPPDLLQIDPKEFKSELDKQVTDDTTSPPKDDEDIEDWREEVEGHDVNSDTPESR